MPWEEALDVSVVAVVIERDEPLAHNKTPLNAVDATNVRADSNATVGNS
jgi:hypothetical protein|tara:strand:- start:144 stop:290 length:147 start_codon:yes stop_codon:yes gene_type:complete